jgi:hypothetical protein
MIYYEWNLAIFLMLTSSLFLRYNFRGISRVIMMTNPTVVSLSYYKLGFDRNKR